MAGTVDCGVCLDFPLDGFPSDYFVTTECGHIFHLNCLKQAYDSGPKTCPLCRQRILPNNWRKLCGIQATENLPHASVNSHRAGEKSDCDYKFKIILVGNSGVGKTSLFQRYLSNSFQPNEIATIGVDWRSKMITVGSKRICLSIWDTAGQERFFSIMPNYFRGVHGAMLVYDVTDPASFEGINQWENSLSMYAPKDIIKVLIGNKTDINGQRKVSTQTGKALAWNANMSFFETSAKDAVNVEIAFKSLAAKILETNSIIEAIKTKMEHPNVELNDNGRGSGSCCC